LTFNYLLLDGPSEPLTSRAGKANPTEPATLQEFELSLELSNPNKKNGMAETFASQLPMREQQAKPNALYKLSKSNISFPRIDIRRVIFSYRVS
jgi:hypothetical protein